MAKITRVHQKVFAKNAGTGQIGKFGSLAAGLPETTSDASLVQSLANFESGFFSAVLGNNSPAIQDVNALHFLGFRQLAYLFQQGVPEWDTLTEYHQYSLAMHADGNLYQSLVNNNTGNALTDYAKWKPFSSTPTGVGMDYMGASAPSGFILSSGKTIGSSGSGALERANSDTFFLYELLWSTYDNTYLPIEDSSGVATTRGASALIDFQANKRLPTIDKRGRVSVGKDNMGGTAANRMTTGGSGVDGSTLGATGGSQTHTLSTPEIPSHTHTQNSHNHTQSAHSHTVTSNNTITLAGGGAQNVPREASTNDTLATSPTTATNVAATAVNQSTGGGGAHNNTQPSIVMNYIIKL